MSAVMNRNVAKRSKAERARTLGLKIEGVAKNSPLRMQTAPSNAAGTNSRQPVDLARHDEIVLVQAFDLLGLQRYRRIAPAEVDVGVVALGFGELADPPDEIECFAEIAETEGALDPVGIIEQRPIPSFVVKPLGLLAAERRNAAPAGSTGFCGQSFSHVLAPVSLRFSTANLR